jgi:hypothetical protein
MVTRFNKCEVNKFVPNIRFAVIGGYCTTMIILVAGGGNEMHFRKVITAQTSAAKRTICKA